ncbi:hypothetical protein HDU87_006530 [Geranomyces variabilis]|uniref:Uncharacterized protein n=1 Tax=Geranomyces variabilis TaxID=109894 RepID=A0AAD5TF56_9FUNG|nr:hypothetical protein HDU87_006530 [Geranomyces variabilis]
MSSEASPPAAAAPAGPRRPSQYEQCQEEIRQLHAQQKKKAHARERAPSAEAAHNSGQAKKAKHTTAVAAESDVAHADTGGDAAQKPVRAGGAAAASTTATAAGASSSPAPGSSSGAQPMDDVEELGAPIDLRDRRGILKKMMERGHSQSLVEMFTLERSPSKEEVERMAQQLHLHPQEVWDFFEAMRATALAKWTREKKEAGEAAHVSTAFPSTSSRRSSHYGTTPSDRIPTADRSSIPLSSSSAQSEAARRASFVQQAPRSIVMIDPYGRRPSLVLNPVIPGAQLVPGQLVYPGPGGSPGYIAAQVYFPHGTTPQGSHASTPSHGEQKHARQHQKAQQQQQQQHGHRRPSTAPGGGAGGSAGSYQAQHEKKQQQQHTPTSTPVTPGSGHSSQQSYFQQPPLVYVPQYYLPPMGYPNQQQQRQQHKQQQQQQQQQQARRPSTASRTPSFAAAGGGGQPPTMQPHHHPATGPARSRAGSQAFNLAHFASSGNGGGSTGSSAPVPGTVSYVPTSATAATSGTAMHNNNNNGNSHYQHHTTSNNNHHHPSASTTSTSSSSPAQQQHRARDYYQPRSATPAAMVIDPMLEHRRSAASVPTAATVAAAAAAARTRRMSAAGLVPAPAPPAPYDKA